MSCLYELLLVSYTQVTDSYCAYVCDLGVAKLQNQLATIHTSEGVGAGTVPYKAPEMFCDCRCRHVLFRVCSHRAFCRKKDMA